MRCAKRYISNLGAGVAEHEIMIRKARLAKVNPTTKVDGIITAVYLYV